MAANGVGRGLVCKNQRWLSGDPYMASKAAIQGGFIVMLRIGSSFLLWFGQKRLAAWTEHVPKLSWNGDC